MKLLVISLFLASYLEANEMIDAPTNCKTQQECNLISQFDAQLAESL